nr:MAG TPA: hypothetical protein [Caudoviricetes sp.]
MATRRGRSNWCNRSSFGLTTRSFFIAADCSLLAVEIPRADSDFFI